MKALYSITKILLVLFLAIVLMTLPTCKKSAKETVNVPTIITTNPENVTETTATLGGYLSSDGGANVTQRGICYSTNPIPSIADEILLQSGGTGTFRCDLTGLAPNTTYYAKAFGVNSTGVGYGNQVTFKTLAHLVIPTVTTDSVSNIKSVTASGFGNVTSDGGSPVTARGFCWSQSNNPSLSDNHTTDSSGTGNFVSNLINLSPLTNYYVRAYATNSIGTAYGNELNFTTASFLCGDPVNYGGKTYHTIRIGTQCWFKENLNIGTMIDQSVSQTNNGIIEKYCYNNNPDSCSIYGGLYQWDELMQYSTTEGAQGICPSDWHIPTDAEWIKILVYLGGETVAGGKMKETGTDHWHSPNTGATNESGFTALPGGIMFQVFDNGTYYGFFWSSTVIDYFTAYYFDLNYNTAGFYQDNAHYRTSGMSARCVHN